MKPVVRALVAGVALGVAIQATAAMASPLYGLRETLRRSPAAVASGAEARHAVLARPQNDALLAIERRRVARQEADFVAYAESAERVLLAKANPQPSQPVAATRLGQRVQSGFWGVLNQDPFMARRVLRAADMGLGDLAD